MAEKYNLKKICTLFQPPPTKNPLNFQVIGNLLKYLIHRIVNSLKWQRGVQP